MVELKEIVLADLLQNKGYIRGPFGSALKRPEMKPEGIPVYEQQHAIYNSREFRFYIDEEKFQELKRFQVETNDLVISCSGTVGKVTIIRENDPKGIISQALLILRADSKKVLPEYLKYFFSSHNGYNAIVSRSSGSVQVNISKREVIEKIPLLLPELDVQEKIVSILNAIDYKIDTNEKINRNLEYQAQLLFNEWFILKSENYSYTTTPEFGDVRSDFSIIKIGDISMLVTDFVANGSFASLKANVTLYQEPGYAYFIRNTDLKAGTFGVFVDKHSYEFLSKSELRGGEIIISNVGDVGSVFLCPSLDKPMTLGNNIIMLRPEDELINNYLYVWFKWGYGQGTIKGITGGSAQPKFNKTDFKNTPVIMPTQELLTRYDEVVRPMFETISKNNRENQRLSGTRDTLLPKIMSGEFDISDLDI